jgi:hypothetical protein
VNETARARLQVKLAPPSFSYQLGRPPCRPGEVVARGDVVLDDKSGRQEDVARQLRGCGRAADAESRRPRPTLRVRFWEGMEADIDLPAVARAAIPVKGVAYHSPLRFLETFVDDDLLKGPSRLASRSIDPQQFLPRIPGVAITLGDGVSQPPFSWKDAAPEFLCQSFTYNVNAFYRILCGLRDRELIEDAEVEPALGEACCLLAALYKAEKAFLLRSINNNLNMFLISRIIETLVGPHRYSAERQEVWLTRRSLDLALQLAPAHASLSLPEKMAVALGTGVSFAESRLGAPPRATIQAVEDISRQYAGCHLAIDHRERLLARISNAGLTEGAFILAVVLDDTTESVDDLLWITDLLIQFPFLRINLVVNTAQISINFSADMLRRVLATPVFRTLRSSLGAQLTVTEIYCPLISFQTSYLPPAARRAIDDADAVFVKGANFFETCQIPEKDTYYGFVVFGPVSRTYTGLHDLDAVFVNVPAGTTGYVHRGPRLAPLRLTDIVGAGNSMTERRSDRDLSSRGRPLGAGGGRSLS